MSERRSRPLATEENPTLKISGIGVSCREKEAKGRQGADGTGRSPRRLQTCPVAIWKRGLLFPSMETYNSLPKAHWKLEIVICSKGEQSGQQNWVWIDRGEERDACPFCFLWGGKRNDGRRSAVWSAAIGKRQTGFRDNEIVQYRSIGAYEGWRSLCSIQKN